MKKFIPRLIAWGILLLVGAVVVLSSFSTELLTIVAVVLGAVALAVFVGKNHSVAHDAPWFAAGGLLLAVIIPKYMTAPEALPMVLDRLSVVLNEFVPNSLFSIGVLGFLGAQLFLRYNKNIPSILLRYAALTALLLGLGSGLSVWWSMFNVQAITIILLCLAYELRTLAYGLHKRRTLCCLLCTLGCYLVSAVFGTDGKWLMDALFLLTDGWLYVIIGAAILGGLMILEEYNNQKKLGEAPSDHADLGGALLFWSLLCLIMKLWGATMNWFVLVPGMIVAYFCYGLFMLKWRKRGDINEHKTFLIVWSLITLGALVLSKSINSFVLMAILIIVLLVAAAVCWAVSTRKKNEWLIMTSYLGVAAVVLLSGVLCPDLNDTMAVAKTILRAVLLSVSWCVLCNTSAKLDRQASDIHQAEFKLVQKIESFAPTAIIAIAVLMTLFA